MYDMKSEKLCAYKNAITACMILLGPVQHYEQWNTVI